MARKWIAKRIDELDPTTDYDEIWKLGSAYRPNDFMMNLIYAVTFPHFFVREHDARPLINQGQGKILTKADKRSDDTSWKMQVWWHYGSHHEETRKNVESINRLHAHYAKQFPDSGFKYNDSYLYTLCYEAAGLHRLLRRVGLPGISRNEQLAAVPYWRQMGTLFRNAATGGEVTGFPDTFEEMMDYMDRYEAEAVPKHDMGRVAARAIIQQFADRYFPKAAHPAVRAWVISLYPEHLVSAYDLPEPHPVVKRAMRLFTAAIFAMGEKVLPDPTDTFTERRQAAKAGATKKRAASPKFTEAVNTASSQGDEPASPSAIGDGVSAGLTSASCPHMQRAAMQPLLAES